MGHLAPPASGAGELEVRADALPINCAAGEVNDRRRFPDDPHDFGAKPFDRGRFQSTKTDDGRQKRGERGALSPDVSRP